MEKEQQMEWAEAQKIEITVDLVAAAKQQLRFLAEVDKHPQLYDGPVSDHAIYRYKYCWLPLLAKHLQDQVSEGPFVVPLDCEWIWHCHRLNPVRYINDCKELYGKILGNWNVASSTQAICKKQSEEIWNRIYPDEPYEPSMNTLTSRVSNYNVLQAQKSTDYDLISAVKRQSLFYFQVSRPHMKDNTFLEESVARYKGFLHLIKRNKERSIRQFCVPTYDIDLIWHSHLLQPVAYCKDLVAILGRVLEHDDTVSDRTKGQKLDTGFSATTKQWAETFGSRYWRAGAMHIDSALSPPTMNVSKLDSLSKMVIDSNGCKNTIQIPKKMFVEVMLEIIEIKHLPAEHKRDIFVTFSKKQADIFFCGKTRLSILESDPGEKQIAVFQCEPVGELVCELVSYSPPFPPATSPAEVLGTASISLQDLVKSGSRPLMENWFELTPNSKTVSSQPINLRIAISVTPPVLAVPFMLNLVNMHGRGNSTADSNYSAVHGVEKMNGGGNRNGGSSCGITFHGVKNEGRNCNGGSSCATTFHIVKNGGGNCDGGSSCAKNGGGNCNGRSSCGTTFNGVKKMDGERNFDIVKSSHYAASVEETMMGSHCANIDHGAGDIVKSSRCGGCGGCGGGGCRGGGCHGDCGHDNK